MSASDFALARRQEVRTLLSALVGSLLPTAAVGSTNHSLALDFALNGVDDHRFGTPSPPALRRTMRRVLEKLRIHSLRSRAYRLDTAFAAYLDLPLDASSTPELHWAVVATLLALSDSPSNAPAVPSQRPLRADAFDPERGVDVDPSQLPVDPTYVSYGLVDSDDEPLDTCALALLPRPGSALAISDDDLSEWSDDELDEDAGGDGNGVGGPGPSLHVVVGVDGPGIEPRRETATASAVFSSLERQRVAGAARALPRELTALAFVSGPHSEATRREAEDGQYWRGDRVLDALPHDSLAARYAAYCAERGGFESGATPASRMNQTDVVREVLWMLQGHATPIFAAVPVGKGGSPRFEVVPDACVPEVTRGALRSALYDFADAGSGVALLRLVASLASPPPGSLFGAVFQAFAHYCGQWLNTRLAPLVAELSQAARRRESAHGDADAVTLLDAYVALQPSLRSAETLAGLAMTVLPQGWTSLVSSTPDAPLVFVLDASAVDGSAPKAYVAASLLSGLYQQARLRNGPESETLASAFWAALRPYMGWLNGAPDPWGEFMLVAPVEGAASRVAGDVPVSEALAEWDDLLRPRSPDAVPSFLTPVVDVIRDLGRAQEIAPTLGIVLQSKSAGVIGSEQGWPTRVAARSKADRAASEALVAHPEHFVPSVGSSAHVALPVLVPQPLRLEEQCVDKANAEVIEGDYDVRREVERLVLAPLRESQLLTCTLVMRRALEGSNGIVATVGLLREALDDGSGVRSGWGVQLELNLQLAAAVGSEALSVQLDGEGGDVVDRLRIEAQVAWPAAAVVRSEHVDAYNEVLRFLLRIRGAKSALARMVVESRVRRSESGIGTRTHALQVFRARLYHFVVNLEQYMMTRVVESAWGTLMNELKTAATLDAARAAHAGYLSAVVDRALLGPKARVVREGIEKVLKLALAFRHEFDVYVAAVESFRVRDESASEARMQAMESDFDSWIKFLLGVVARITGGTSGGSSYPHLLDLLIRLDFNSYYGVAP
ncbi:uncharacterized protein AMSG_03640 [Thecamonas trahens ATCC 50062]|uniref:Spindle pole body component n=1 Tax=Thecamonas trahens ATCC 50062 TaxID=461836 RepID=A0A0L0D4B8_THETB|nr:hypothetical protein AMSG_03640 [Thecamonas trahens ATCC 50062]KNC47212.1 hypothetical protein AMSG_03640 [Thecamonas trahens ATCC 50062]|eukprot:XP_013759981.1 hypothetical protein AMSG_03640 [Thecamonas trahens ATCC 50062]